MLRLFQLSSWTNALAMGYNSCQKNLGLEEYILNISLSKAVFSTLLYGGGSAPIFGICKLQFKKESIFGSEYSLCKKLYICIYISVP